jgi:hypothetical protein
MSAAEDMSAVDFVAVAQATPAAAAAAIGRRNNSGTRSRCGLSR